MLTHSATLYLAAVLIWGSSWFAIKFQLGPVAPEVSIVYRFALAALILLAWCRLRGLSLRFGASEHAWIALQGVFLFCLNYLVFYWATGVLTSGLIAVIFSTIVLFNIVNAAVFLRHPVRAQVLVGALMGSFGIGLIFWPEIRSINLDDEALRGVLLSVIGTILASFGNMISSRNQRFSIPVVQSNAIGMAWGAALLAAWALYRDVPFDLPIDWRYGASLIYLSLFASVLAFGSYLTLLGRIGPARAAYATVLFPVVALAISTLFEAYTWSSEALLGVVLVLAGNLVILKGGVTYRAPAPAITAKSI